MNLEESFGMPQPAAALSITNMMNPHLFFFIALQSSLLPYETRAACILLLSIAGDLLITEQ